MSLSSIKNVVNPLRHIPGMGKASKFMDKLVDPLGLFADADDLGNPPKTEDPNVTLAREAKNSAIAGDIAVRNAQQRSSTLGAGSRFIEQQMSKTISPIKPTGPLNTRSKGKNPLGAGTSYLGGA